MATSAARMMHAGGHTRSTVGHQLAAGRRARGLEGRAQIVGREEAAVGGEGGEGEVHGARDVARHRVDRLDFAAVALGCACVEEERTGECFGFGAIALPRPGLERSRRSFLRTGRQRAALGPPAAQTAVEHSHTLVAEVPQQPPEPGGASLGGLVVRHDQRVGSEPGPAGGRREGIRFRQRVPSSLAGLR